MGWLWLAIIGAAIFAALWRMGIARELGWIVGSALAVGATGYAWQQHAFLPGHPVRPDAEKIHVDPGLAAFRSAIMPGNEAVFGAADERLRVGEPTGAVQVILDAIGQQPGDAGLWAGLGVTLAAHDGGQLSPAALFAFQKAMTLAPDAPGPPFLLGLAQIQAGHLPETKIAWLRVLALTPHDAPYRIDIAERLALIDQFMAMQAGNVVQQHSRTGD